MSHHLGPMLAFDLETTGRDPQDARIVTACLVWQEGPGEETTVASFLLNPGVDIPEEAAAIHGVTTEQAQREGADAAVGVRVIGDHLTDWFMKGQPVVAFNASYDLTVVQRELERHGHQQMPMVRPVIDPHVIDKQMDKYRPGKRTLTATAAHYGVKLESAHSADADALAALQLARLLPVVEPRLAAPADLLHSWTVGWRAQQSKGLQQHLRSTGDDPKVKVNGAWPIQWAS